MKADTTFRSRLTVLAASVCLLLPLGGCDIDKVVEADTPDIIPPDALTGPEALPAVRGAVIGDFALAYGGSGADGSGGTEGTVMTSGMLADEWINSETFPTRIEIDRRGPISITNATAETWFRTISRARATADLGQARFRQYSPDTTLDAGLSEIISLQGFLYLFFAENYCSGVPFSYAQPDGSFIYGQPLTTGEMLDTAEARFTSALAAATALQGTGQTRANRINIARVGLGRALLDQGQFAAAAAAVALVPDTFRYSINHSENTARQNNGVFQANVTFERYSVANAEGVNGLNYRTAADPRIPFIRTPANDVGFDQATPQFDQLRYIDRRAAIVLASGAEARLIEAEAFLQAGDTVGGGQFLARLNALRATPPTYFPLVAGGTLAPLTPAASPAAREDQLFRERAFWLWLTGHRLWDLRRLARPTAVGGYGRAINSVFPTGAYFKGAFTYGPDVNFPVPFDEQNNPNFAQCLDRNP